MAKKTHQKQFSLADQLIPIMDQYKQEMRALKEQALDKASDFFVEQLSQASPERTGSLKHGWTRTTKYKSVRYIGNTAVTAPDKKGHQIPLSNIVEYSSKGNPFIRLTFEENREKIIDIIKETIENGNSQQAGKEPD
jgi:hypothetical protein